MYKSTPEYLDEMLELLVALNHTTQFLLNRIDDTLFRMEQKMTKRPRSTSSKKPTYPASVKQLKGRVSNPTENVSYPKNVQKQKAKARPARGR